MSITYVQDDKPLLKLMERLPKEKQQLLHRVAKELQWFDGKSLGKGRWQFLECAGGGSNHLHIVHNSDIDVFWTVIMLRHNKRLENGLRKLILGNKQ